MSEVRIRILLFSEIMLAKQDFNKKFLGKIKFLRLKIMCLWLSYKQKKCVENNFVFASLKSLKKEVGSRIGPGSGFISQRYGSTDTDPDPHQKVTDLQHWKGRKVAH